MTLSILEVLTIARKLAKNDSELARRTGVARSTFYRIERGQTCTKRDLQTMGKLARFILEAE
jgi:DNA-binding XRE family transcriptional regulator